MASSSTFQISNRTAFSRALEKKASPIVRLKAEQFGVLAQRYAEVEARSLFGDRPPSRRNAGRLHYRTNFYHRTSGAQFPITVTIGNRARHAVIIEKGQKAHQIRKGVVIPGLGLKGVHDGVQAADRNPGPPWVKTQTPVDHPGSTKGKGLMKRSVNLALRQNGIRRGITEVA